MTVRKFTHLAIGQEEQPMDLYAYISMMQARSLWLQSASHPGGVEVETQ